MYRLRELDRRDLKRINEWRNNKNIISFLGAPFRYINEEVDEKWFENYMSNRNNDVRCSIINDEGNLIGLVSLTSIDSINRSAVFGIMIGDESSQNKGAGTFATQEMLKHAFFNLNLNRVELGVLATNGKAIHLYEKCGFVKEGTKRASNFKEGEYIDMYIYSILRQDYDELKNK